jgi:hypothetical protein
MKSQAEFRLWQLPQDSASRCCPAATQQYDIEDLRWLDIFAYLCARILLNQPSHI